MKIFVTVFAGLLLVTILQSATAQSPAAVQQLDSAQERRRLEAMQNPGSGETVPQLLPEESSDVGPQTVLQIKARPTHFEAQADVQFFHTDNMLLLEDDEQSAQVLLSTIQLALAPTAYELGGGQFSPRAGYRHQWFNFGLTGGELDGTSVDLDEFDFNAQTAFIDGRWACNNWIAEAGFDFTRLMDSDYDGFYREYVPRWGLRRLFPVCEASTISVGYEGDYRFAEATDLPSFVPSDLLDRTDHALVAAWTIAVCERAVVQPYYRFRYTHFTGEENRDDYLHTVGLGIYCNLTRNLSLRAFVNYESRSSDEDLVSDYHRFDAGGGVNLIFRF